MGAIQLYYNESFWSTGRSTSVPSDVTADTYAAHNAQTTIGSNGRVDDTVNHSEIVPISLSLGSAIVPANEAIDEHTISGGADDDGVLEEVLTVNDFWTTRLSKTMSKMKKKRHIARCRTMRKERKAVKSTHAL